MDRIELLSQLDSALKIEEFQAKKNAVKIIAENGS